jgi:hypothetical protein
LFSSSTCKTAVYNYNPLICPILLQQGPQFALYVPSGVVQTTNEIIVLELHEPTKDLSVTFFDHHDYHTPSCDPTATAVVNSAVALWNSGANAPTQLWSVLYFPPSAHINTIPAFSH